MSSPKEYLLSPEADRDLEEIFDYSVEKFGLDQTVKYLMELESVMIHLTEHPETGMVRDEIKIGLRSFPISSHIVFYRALDDHIRIVRVLHASRDIPRFLE